MAYADGSDHPFICAQCGLKGLQRDAVKNPTTRLWVHFHCADMPDPKPRAPRVRDTLRWSQADPDLPKAPPYPYPTNDGVEEQY